jgi:hypothetical protein
MFKCEYSPRSFLQVPTCCFPDIFVHFSLAFVASHVPLPLASPPTGRHVKLGQKVSRQSSNTNCCPGKDPITVTKLSLAMYVYVYVYVYAGEE